MISAHAVSFRTERNRTGSSHRHWAFCDRYVFAGASGNLRPHGGFHRRRPGNVNGLFFSAWNLPDRIWSSVGHGWPQATSLRWALPIRRRVDRLRIFPDNRMVDRIPVLVPRAIIRDLHTGLEAARLMSLVMLVFSVSPILAPLLGSALRLSREFVVHLHRSLRPHADPIQSGIRHQRDRVYRHVAI